MLDRILNIPDLTEKQFNEISNLVRNLAGINLHQGKQELVKARLNKRLRQLGMDNYREYIAYLKNGASDDELVQMLDAISTNLTSFFREADHFEYLADKYLADRIKNASKQGKKIRVWSAGCSTGEEAYTLAMIVISKIPNLSAWDVKILATDLSTTVLRRAKEGIYNAENVESLPGMIRSRFFNCIESSKPRSYQVTGELRDLTHFARLNLMNSWPMKGPFDVIFCRNVMIYFNKQTQEKLINRYYDLLGPDGLLFIGHSESLAGVKHLFKYEKPTIYEKK